MILNDDSRTAKARFVILVIRSPCNEEISLSSLGSRVSPENDDERKKSGRSFRKQGKLEILQETWAESPSPSEKRREFFQY